MQHDAATPARSLPVPLRLPAVDKVLQDAAMQSLRQSHGLDACTRAVRQALAELREQLRQQVQKADRCLATVDVSQVIAQAQVLLEQRFASRLRPVFNLTGTVLHTNLGRALLPQAAVASVVQAMTAAANLEYDLDDGGRGDRDDLIEALICDLTGAEAATVVNNNAAAVLLSLATLAAGKEVIVSRGELVEIGGAFRIPDVMRHAGASLVEIGTTNRTHERDYAQAIGEQTAALMKVHCSNYAITGFTKSVGDADVARIAHGAGLDMIVDLGSGTLVDLREWGLPYEVTVRETVEAGADLVTFSGDKLLGGPQAGLIVGRKDLIARIKKHPLKRALRVGKLTLAALDSTLRLYLHPEQLARQLTTLRLFTRTRADMQAQARELQPQMQQALGPGFVVQVADMSSQIGSGALPVESLPSAGLRIEPASAGAVPGRLSQLEAWLRALPRPVIGRLHDNALWLDLRCLEASDQPDFVKQLQARGQTAA
ncbi:L-seryl-tRNA(Sec) selenium transferase [Comamonas composti]|uniref:L-seryl-tRNA(Sec) selenium transferase n=1 Tax=Comamonas composti TaxID=408558 RepID=UPI00047A05F2|nr:L-seryl-tRNA(Sec) selenium transferase [Comamonas composti]